MAPVLSRFGARLVAHTCHGARPGPDDPGRLLREYFPILRIWWRRCRARGRDPRGRRRDHATGCPVARRNRAGGTAAGLVVGDTCRAEAAGTSVYSAHILTCKSRWDGFCPIGDLGD